MNEPYLWDRSGAPDPEIQELEEMLAPFRHRGEFRAPRPRPAWIPAAIAAAAVVGASAWLISVQPEAKKSLWAIVEVEGAASIGGKAIAPASMLPSGQTLRTGPSSKVTLASDEFGELEVQSDSELRVLQSAASSQRLRLDRGVLHAFIWAPARQFVVDTPAARAVDMGCEYTLSVDRQGNGMIDVEFGWVAFEFRGRESFIPAGATCATTIRNGPGMPVYKDASEPFRKAVAAYEDIGDPAALGVILAEARARDGLTLWHLLPRVPAAERGRVFDRFAALIPLPGGVTRDGVVALNPGMVDQCWDALDLDDTEWWRGWERSWQP